MKFKPCPHCGCIGICEHEEPSKLGRIIVIHCQDCSAGVHGRSKRKVRQEWNARVKEEKAL